MTLFDAAPPGSASEPERLRLVVAYDGTDFHGFAAQQAARTVQGVLVEAIQQALRAPVEGFACAGRTDSGVHAWGQVVTFDVDTSGSTGTRSVTGKGPIDTGQLRRTLNRRLAPEIVVRAVDPIDAGFDARRSASWRRYRYTIVNRPDPDPFLARYSWWVPEPLDLPMLRLAADPFVGEHDFAAFCRKGAEGSTTVRRVLTSAWTATDDGLLTYEIRSTSFCWQMVRSVVGMLVDIGMGRRTPGEVLSVIRSLDRARATRLAPPSGLCLWEVGYDADGSSPR